MTREEIKLIFPEATDEQITKMLNQSNTEVATEKAKAAYFYIKKRHISVPFPKRIELCICKI